MYLAPGAGKMEIFIELRDEKTTYMYYKNLILLNSIDDKSLTKFIHMSY